MLRRRLPELNLIFEDESQIRDNCFIAQLYEKLTEHFTIIHVSREQLTSGITPFPASALVLSLLKQRSWRRLIPYLARATEKSGAYYYDQDPWEAYFGEASNPGAYTQLYGCADVRAFLVTSGWWARRIVELDQLPVKFVRMGMLPKLCDRGRPYEMRPIEVGFQGTLHANRAAFFDRMKNLGVDVTFKSSLPYRKFLKSVQDFRIYLHHEKLPDGSPCNGIWVKEVEAAARGLFAIRNSDADEPSYALDELPTVFTFSDETEVPQIIDSIRSMTDRERNERIAQAVDRVRQRDDWKTVVQAIQT